MSVCLSVRNKVFQPITRSDLSSAYVLVSGPLGQLSESDCRRKPGLVSSFTFSNRSYVVFAAGITPTLARSKFTKHFVSENKTNSRPEKNPDSFITRRKRKKTWKTMTATAKATRGRRKKVVPEKVEDWEEGEEAEDEEEEGVAAEDEDEEGGEEGAGESVGRIAKTARSREC